MSQRVRVGQRAPTQRMSSSLKWLVLLLLVVALTLFAFWWKSRQLTLTEQSKPEVTQSSRPQADAALSSEPDQGSLQQIVQGQISDFSQQKENSDSNLPQHPIEDAQAVLVDVEDEGEGESILQKLAFDFLGKQQVYAMLQLDGFARRVVSTTDNLARASAPSRVWPLIPMADKFLVTDANFEPSITPENYQRYSAIVQVAKNIDIQKLAQNYRTHYALFQKAYEDLGYPDKYFNDRLVQVIGHLLQAPEPVSPKVVLLQVRGKMPMQQPWKYYKYADAQLEELSAGQKIMVRVGPQNAKILKKLLREFRQLITH